MVPDGAVKIRADAVHLIDEANARDVILVALAPNCFGLRLHARHSVKHRHRAIEHAQTALHFSGEIDVARRVDDIDGAILPLAGGRSRGNGDAPLLLLLHPIHHRRTFVDFANLIGTARVIENALRGCGFPGINVRHDADIAHFLECYCTGHKTSSL